MPFSLLLQLAAPQAILVIASLAVLAADLKVLAGLRPEPRRLISGMLALGGCVVAAGWIYGVSASVSDLRPMIFADVFTRWGGLGVLLLTGLSVLLVADSAISEHIGEFYALALVAAAGMLFLIATEDLLLAFISLELTSICLYTLTGFSSRRPQSSEAALKYFLFGGVSAAITLFGISLLYGFGGSTAMSAVAAAVAGEQPGGALAMGDMARAPLLQVAMVMTLAGFAFKVAAAPFHLWAPDVYQAAPVPAAALIASASKLAGFIVLAKVVTVGFAFAGRAGQQGTETGSWLVLLAVLAAVSIAVGNLAALAQTSVKRLLAYSAVAHAGYVLLGVMTPGQEGLASVVFYALTYGLATVGAFAVLGVVENQGGDDSFAALAGLGRRSPFLSACLLVFVLSLAGIPPLAGFFAKFWVFATALRAGPQELRLVWLVLLALAGSCVSLYYYLRILKQVYLRAPALEEGKLSVPLPTRVVVGVSAAGVVLLGCAPGIWVKALLGAGGEF